MSAATILDAALRMFATRAYDAVTLDAVGVAAGLDRPSVELAFPTKALLFQTLLDRELARVRATIVAAVPSAPRDDLTPGAAVSAALAALQADAEREPAPWRLLLNAERESQDDGDTRDQLRELLRTRLRWLIAARAPLAPADRRLVSDLTAVLVAALIEIRLEAIASGRPPADLPLAEGLDRLLSAG